MLNLNFVCPCCGRGASLSPCIIITQGNYESTLDTKLGAVKLCDSCYAQLYSAIQNALSTGALETEFTQ